MSTEKGVGAESLPSQGTTAPAETSSARQESRTQAGSPAKQEHEERPGSDPGAETEAEEGGRKPAARTDEASGASSPPLTNRPRQVIAVSASKGPAAFFNLARKFLVTDEMCDLSALEGAIVSAVDAAHLLERSQLATIVRVHTSYVTVEPKRRKQAPQQGEQEEDGAFKGGTGSSQQAPSAPPAAAMPAAIQHQAETRVQAPAAHAARQGGTRSSGSGGRELRRARIVITVRRTESYRRWLEENPLQAIIAGSAEEADPERAQEEGKPS